MRPGRVVALVVGCLLVLPGIGMLLGGAALGVGVAAGRDDDGFVSADLDGVRSDGVAVTAEGIVLVAEPDTPDWLLEWASVDVRLEAAAVGERPLFVGIGPEDEVDAYLAGTAHSEVEAVDGGTPRYREQDGRTEVAPPSAQGFWVATSEGTGTRSMTWEVTAGRWAVVLMHADGSPGVAADVTVGVDAGMLVPVAVALGSVGVLVTVLAIVLVVVGATGGERPATPAAPPAGPPAVGVPVPPPPPPVGVQDGRPPSPVRLTARLDRDLSRWQWLVKWVLAIPHLVVLGFLWLAFSLLTVVAGFAILFTGTYPRAIFDFTTGVLRWTWRVSYYAASGGLGTDRYPPFSLGDEPDYPATLDIDYPERLSRGLVLVKWWLLAIPHYIIIGLLTGGGYRWVTDDGVRVDTTGGGGILGILVLVAAIALLVTGRYPQALFDVIIGFNRWVYRVIAYAALMTDAYPPFRLDQGGDEPGGTPLPTPPTGPPDTAARDLAPVGPRMWS
ncbi:DUF4389 domain-containing protein [Euzebya sp.]|uniref:DUF4389 domain-containing protein n=1 Tax=Euzebya sp. TaxID=1971409 RepID=UPI003518FCFE